MALYSLSRRVFGVFHGWFQNTRGCAGPHTPSSCSENQVKRRFFALPVPLPSVSVLRVTHFQQIGPIQVHTLIPNNMSNPRPGWKASQSSRRSHWAPSPPLEIAPGKACSCPRTRCRTPRRVECDWNLRASCKPQTKCPT